MLFLTTPLHRLPGSIAQTPFFSWYCSIALTLLFSLVFRTAGRATRHSRGRRSWDAPLTGRCTRLHVPHHEVALQYAVRGINRRVPWARSEFPGSSGNGRAGTTKRPPKVRQHCTPGICVRNRTSRHRRAVSRRASATQTPASLQA
jgi:hypothetical protein